MSCLVCTDLKNYLENPSAVTCETRTYATICRNLRIEETSNLTYASHNPALLTLALVHRLSLVEVVAIVSEPRALSVASQYSKRESLLWRVFHMV